MNNMLQQRQTLIIQWLASQTEYSNSVCSCGEYKDMIEELEVLRRKECVFSDRLIHERYPVMCCSA